MPINTTPWPHVDIGGLPDYVRKFLLATIVVSLYLGTMLIVLVSGLVVANVVTHVMQTGSFELGSLAVVLTKIV
jgi:hypothetical protein